jgi:hypothetical protein
MIKKFLMLFAVFLPSLLLAADASAFVSWQTGQVTKLFIRSNDGLVYFFLSGDLNGRPACASGGYWMIKDENSPSGKRQVAALLAARLSGQVITVTGLGTCTRWSDGEDLDSILI